MIYLNAEYKLNKNLYYFLKKYRANDIYFKVEDKAENVLGENWIDLSRPVVIQFLARMASVDIFDFTDRVVLYGKCYTNHEGFPLAELVLLDEIAMDYTVEEFEKLLKTKKIKML